jgi:hypothetical protein
VPVDGKWSLAERPGFLRLHSLPATSFWDARNSLTQRAIGPLSSPTVALDVSGLKNGDVAGLALLNQPYASLGVEKDGAGLTIALYDQGTDQTTRVRTTATRLWLRADCDFLTEKARFSYSENGKDFVPIGGQFTMVFQLTTFQGVRYALFNYNTQGADGGFADFDSIDVYQPYPHGLMRAIPLGRQVRLVSFRASTGLAVVAGQPVSGEPAAFMVKDMGLGRVALQLGERYLSVAADGKASLETGQPGTAQGFQWIETPTGELVLMSLVTNRFLRIDPRTGKLMADSPGPQPDGSDGVRFNWTLASAN